MTRHKNDTQDENESQVPFEAMLREQLQQVVRTALISVLEEEVDAFIGAVRALENDPHQQCARTALWRGQASLS